VTFIKKNRHSIFFAFDVTAHLGINFELVFFIKGYISLSE
jgi:hypothetical protein